jgi:hypothetical protein
MSVWSGARCECACVRAHGWLGGRAAVWLLRARRTKIEGPAGEDLPVHDRYLIQRSIHNMLTVAHGQDGNGAEWQCVPYTEGGYKTRLRAYLISRGDGAFFMCSEMLCYVHEMPYDPNSTDIQADRGCNVFLWSEFDSNPDVKNSVTHACLAAAQKLVPMIHDVMSKYTGELCRGQGALQYQFWGVDFLPTTDNKAYFVEMNGW